MSRLIPDDMGCYLENKESWDKSGLRSLPFKNFSSNLPAGNLELGTFAEIIARRTRINERRIPRKKPLNVWKILRFLVLNLLMLWTLFCAIRSSIEHKVKEKPEAEDGDSMKVELWLFPLLACMFYCLLVGMYRFAPFDGIFKDLGFFINISEVFQCKGSVSSKTLDKNRKIASKLR